MSVANAAAFCVASAAEDNEAAVAVVESVAAAGFAAADCCEVTASLQVAAFAVGIPAEDVDAIVGVAAADTLVVAAANVSVVEKQLEQLGIRWQQRDLVHELW